MTDVLRVAAFSMDNVGGNPAGVVLCESLPDAAEMQAIAQQVGYSETVFAAPKDDAWRVRYFSPEVEVDFCGHATIALGAALAQKHGTGNFKLQLNRAAITVEGFCDAHAWCAAFQSPPTQSRPISPELLTETLSLFGLTQAELNPKVPPAIANAGGDHIVLALNSHEALKNMHYDQQLGRELCLREKLVTFNLVYADTDQVFYSRNPFPVGGVFEDPATGSAAAALAGYLRDLQLAKNEPHQGKLTVYQGAEMGMPSRIDIALTDVPGASVTVSGQVRQLEA
ncbi:MULTISPECIES: PhzF family phenazine biosynthesis protein [unclassified Pseudidiomarina]|uniref:PhzF family phenazine biosynthesis protein n=1 Tax=Pseudidiomarina salilacus TaxID=3384452 RepID=UPI0039846B4D